MAAGGKRPGAGRRKGSTTKRTREIAEAAFDEGITPLEVMLKAMRKHVEAGTLDDAAKIARDAAPYMHPRLNSIEHAGRDGGPIQQQVQTFDLTKMTDEQLAACQVLSSAPRGG